LQAISREPQAGGDRGIYVDALIERERERLVPLLADPRTVLYLCGLIGMQFSVFRRLALFDLLAGFATVAHGSLDPDPLQWAARDMKQALRPTERCMIEVY
jgi:hypothetical protein